MIWSRTAWQPGLEDRARVMIGAKEQPNLDAAIRDGECAKAIPFDRLQPFFWDEVFEMLDESVRIHQFHPTTTTEEAGVICKDATGSYITFVATPRKDTLVIRQADGLQLMDEMPSPPHTTLAYSCPTDPLGNKLDPRLESSPDWPPTT